MLFKRPDSLKAVPTLSQGLLRIKMEAAVGFEPTHEGFADLKAKLKAKPQSAVTHLVMGAYQ